MVAGATLSSSTSYSKSAPVSRCTPAVSSFLRPQSVGACGEFFFTLSLLRLSLCGVSRGHEGAFYRQQ